MPNLKLNTDSPEFSIDTTALDRINILPFTIGEMSKIKKNVAETSTSFMNNIIATFGRKSEGMELTDNDVAKLTDADRNEIAKKLLGFNQDLCKENVQEERTDDEGRVIVSFGHGDVKHKNEEAESESDYLFRLYKIQQRKFV